MSDATASLDPLEIVVIESEVRRVLFRYCRGVDRLDEALVRSCYHEGATDNHGNFDGSVDEFIAWAFGLLRKYTTTMHFLGNILVEPESSTVAFVETYAFAVHRREDGQPHHNLLTGFRYVDRFERRPVDGVQEWRIMRRVVVTEWLRQDPPDGWWPIADVFLTGRRDPTDIAYTRDGLR